MRKKTNRQELLRLGNFTIFGVRDVFGHQTMMEICSASKNWITRFDESTFMFGIIKSVIGMKEDSTETKQWMAYLKSLINVEYQFAISGCPVEILYELGKMLISYSEKQSKESKNPTKKQEKETIADMKREYEMKEELKNIDKNGK